MRFGLFKTTKKIEIKNNMFFLLNFYVTTMKKHTDKTQ